MYQERIEIDEDELLDEVWQVRFDHVNATIDTPTKNFICDEIRKRSEWVNFTDVCGSEHMIRANSIHGIWQNTRMVRAIDDAYMRKWEREKKEDTPFDPTA